MKLQMLARRHAHLAAAAAAEPEHVLGVVRHAGRVAPAPLRIDLVLVLQLPVGQHVAARVEPGLLRTSRTAVCSSVSPSSWLPVTDCQISGVVGALEQQHLQVGRVHHHQYRYRDLELQV